MSGSHVYAAAWGALVPSLLLVDQVGRKFARELPIECNQPLDSVLWLTPEVVYPHLTCMGEAGRALYVNFLYFDLILFPLIYSTVIYGALHRLYKSAGPILALLPIATLLADVMENISVCLMLRAFPQRNETLEFAISIFTRVKVVTLLLALAFVLLGCTRKLLRRRNGTEPLKEPVGKTDTKKTK